MGNEFEEVLLVNDAGNILEGLTSNFFAMDDHILKTADQDVLFGITRSVVIELAKEMGIEIKFEPVKISEIEKISEAFITSSSRGILPISKIDGIKIGHETPGKITQVLMRKFEEKTLSLADRI
mgnify:CR=1 FL=1